MAELDNAPAWDRLAPADDYEVVPADLEHAREDAVRVWASTIGWPGRQGEMYDAYYRGCPAGTPLLMFLRHRPGGEVVGTLGVCPRRVAVDGREVRAGVLSHFCVVRGHRRIKPPAKLFRATIDACRGRFQVIYGMPRTAGLDAFGKLHGVAPDHFVSRRVKLLRFRGYARRVVPGPLAALAGGALDLAAGIPDAVHGFGDTLTAEWIGKVHPEMPGLWRAAPAGGAWNASRDEATLHWRFDRLPSLQRRYLLLRERGSGALVAWFACDTNFFDEHILVVQDFWGAGSPGLVDAAMLRHLCREVRALGFDAVEVRLAGPDLLLAPWRHGGFMERNRYPVFVFWLDRELAVPAGQPLHMTELDNDG